jgi:hypothetical protein
MFASRMSHRARVHATLPPLRRQPNCERPFDARGWLNLAIELDRLGPWVRVPADAFRAAAK